MSATKEQVMKAAMTIDYDAEHFVAQCRRRLPIRHIDEVAPPRIISRDFMTGSADSYDWAEFSSTGLPCWLRRQAE